MPNTVLDTGYTRSNKTLSQAAPGPGRRGTDQLHIEAEAINEKLKVSLEPKRKS